MRVINALAQAFDRQPTADFRSFGERLSGLMVPESVRLALVGLGFAVFSKEASEYSDTGKLELIKRQVRMGFPPILLVGTGPYNIIPHWIAVWGYDDREFIIYDPLKNGGVSLKAGNRVVTNEELLVAWCGSPLYQKNRYLFLGLY